MSEIPSKEKISDILKAKHPKCEINQRIDNIRSIVKKFHELKNDSKLEGCEQVINPCLAQKAYQFEVSEDQNKNKAAKYNDDLATSSNEKSSSSSLTAVSSSSSLGLPSEVPIKAYKASLQSQNLIWYSPYRQDIYNYFRGKEPYFLPKPNYMDWQNLNMGMRSVLINWLVEVVETYNMHAETLHLAVSFIDRFLTYVRIDKEVLQLLGTASLFIASKYEEIHYPELKDFVSFTGNTWTKQQILLKELVILKVLNFDLSIPTAYTYLRLYFTVCNPTDCVCHYAEYLCELSLIEGVFLKYPYSFIAAGSLACASLFCRVDIWDTMEIFTGYSLADLNEICELFFNTVQEIASSSHKAIYEKYKTEKHGCVANLKPFPGLNWSDYSPS